MIVIIAPDEYISGVKLISLHISRDELATVQFSDLIFKWHLRCSH
jgi:hypothetical protein